MRYLRLVRDSELVLLHTLKGDMQSPEWLDAALSAIEPDHIVINKTKERVRYYVDEYREPSIIRLTYRGPGRTESHTDISFSTRSGVHTFHYVVPYDFAQVRGIPIHYIGLEPEVPHEDQQDGLITTDSIPTTPEDTPEGLASRIRECSIGLAGKVVYVCDIAGESPSCNLYPYLHDLSPTRAQITLHF